AGQTMTYTLTVSNNGPSDAQGVVATDVLPAFTTFQSDTTSQGAASNNSGTLTFTFGTIPAGGSATGSIVVLVAAGTPDGTAIKNTATASSSTNDLNPNNDTDTATTTVSTQADVALTKKAPATVVAGQTMTYTLT